MNKETLEVNIFGVTLNIKSKDSDIEHLQELASFVNDNFNEIYNQYSGNQSKEVVAILTCLNLADKLKKIEKENKDNKYLIDNLKASITSRISDLVKLIEVKGVKIDEL